MAARPNTAQSNGCRPGEFKLASAHVGCSSSNSNSGKNTRQDAVCYGTCWGCAAGSKKQQQRDAAVVSGCCRSRQHAAGLACLHISWKRAAAALHTTPAEVLLCCTLHICLQAQCPAAALCEQKHIKPNPNHAPSRRCTPCRSSTCRRYPCSCRHTSRPQTALTAAQP